MPTYAQVVLKTTSSLSSTDNAAIPFCLSWHAQVLQKEELLSEFRALQKLALASNSSQGAGPTGDTGPSDQMTKSIINTETEDYLLQQVRRII